MQRHHSLRDDQLSLKDRVEQLRSNYDSRIDGAC